LRESVVPDTLEPISLAVEGPVGVPAPPCCALGIRDAGDATLEVSPGRRVGVRNVAAIDSQTRKIHLILSFRFESCKWTCSLFAEDEFHGLILVSFFDVDACFPVIFRVCRKQRVAVVSER